VSWDAWLTDDRGHCEYETNYTHNINRMVGAALVALGHEDGDAIGTGVLAEAIGPVWFDLLHGMDGPSGAKFLHDIIGELRRYPVKYQSMNPENGWGDYDSLLKVLQGMRDAVPEWPCTWSVSG